MTRRLIPLFPELVITDVNPGFVETPLYRDSTGPAKFMVGKIGRTAEQGARNVSFALLTLERSTDVSTACVRLTHEAEEASGIMTVSRTRSIAVG